MLHLLQCALALDKHRNYARAAEQLRLSQPTLTRSIQELERQVGAKLFDRSRRGVEPTSFGAIALKSASRIALDVAELNREIALLKGLNCGLLTLGVGPIIAQTWVGDAVGGLLAKHPMLQVRTRDLSWWDIANALHSCEIDLAVGELQEASEDPDIAILPLPHRPVSFFCRTGHPLLQLNRPTIADIGEYPLVAPRLPTRAAQFLAGGRVMGQMAECGKYFEPRIELQSLEAIMQIVRASDAVGVATTKKLEPMIKAGEIAVVGFHASWLKTNYAIMHLRARALSPAAIAFCTQAQEAERHYYEPAGSIGKHHQRPKK